MSPFQNRLAAFLFSFERTFTAAILTVQTALGEQCSSAILKERGDTILFTVVFAGPTWGLPHRARFAVARLPAAAPAHGSRILRAAGSRALSLPRHGAWAGALFFGGYRIRTPESRDSLYSC